MLQQHLPGPQAQVDDVAQFVVGKRPFMADVVFGMNARRVCMFHARTIARSFLAGDWVFGNR
ncbi:MAG: hypothetical protein H6657_24275 [Ardenticatenaceae bacterium]|nr:hypothetical protein [Ardenticatenaceae bacterium]